MENTNSMRSVIAQLFNDNRGLLAADESVGTISKRLSSINLDSTPDTRRTWRNLLLTSPGIEKYIGGVILFEETLYQKTNNDLFFPEYLKLKGIVPGIKVDNGTVPLPGFTSDKSTAGLDNLSDRLKNFKNTGVEFTKWRAVFAIGDNSPSQTILRVNAEDLALYASTCQDQGLIPIIEPEVLMDGAHTIDQCESVTTDVLYEVFYCLQKHKVKIDEIILKPNMVLPGKNASKQSSDSEIAQATVRTLYRTIPPAVPAIAFLSGGQDPIQATSRLNEMNKNKKHPWILSFSFSRALQDPAMKVWRGRQENIIDAQKTFLHRAHCNNLAMQGSYLIDKESRR